MDTKVIESLVPITARPYLREYLRMERVETDKELLAFVLPLIPYDERADLVFESYLNVNATETDVVSKYITILENAREAWEFFVKRNPTGAKKVADMLKQMFEDVNIKDVQYIEPTNELPSEKDIIPLYDDESMKSYMEYISKIK